MAKSKTPLYVGAVLVIACIVFAAVSGFSTPGTGLFVALIFAVIASIGVWIAAGHKISLPENIGKGEPGKKTSVSWLKPSPYWIFLTILLLGFYLAVGSDLIPSILAAVILTIIAIVIFKMIVAVFKGANSYVNKIDKKSKSNGVIVLVGVGIGVVVLVGAFLVWIVWNLPNWVG